METQQLRHDDEWQWEEMDSKGYAILHASEEPSKELREFILTESAKLSREGPEDNPLYYIEPRWDTELWKQIPNYVQAGINVRLFRVQHT
jgi:hypothetical protein